MSVNGSELIDKPWDTIWGPFIDIFGASFWLIPIGIIAAALFMKTREITVTSVWLLVSCSLVGVGVFSSQPELGFMYYIFAIIGLVGVIVGIFFMKGED